MNYFVRSVLLSIGIVHCCMPFDDHFFRASYWCGEPRLSRDALSTWTAAVEWGKTPCARNLCTEKVPLMDLICPTHHSPGIFKIKELQFNFFQNCVDGFFARVYFPARALTFYRMYFPQESSGLLLSCCSQLRPGDVDILLGWAYNYEETEYLDYIDTSLQIGALVPTSTLYNPDHPFDLPTGYNKHAGIPVIFDCSLGLYEWLTAGFHVDSVFLFDKKRKESNHCICEKLGNVFDFQIYGKADHFCGGLSLLLGYSYARQEEGSKTKCLPLPLREGWSMHTMVFLAEYDWADYDVPSAPRISFFYNKIIRGKNIINTTMKGTYVGVDCSWNY